MVIPRALLFAAACLLALVVPAAASAQPVLSSSVIVHTRPVASAAGTDWLADGHDGQLTNESDQPAITPTTARSLHTLWTAELDGPILASPLAFGGVVYASTEHGTVYAVRADDGSVLWSRSLGATATPTCGTWGITSNGAIDAERGLLYIADSDGILRALRLGDGATAWSVTISTRPSAEYVWGGLRLVGDLLEVPVASYCDAPGSDGLLADGRLVSVDVDSEAVASVFDSVPGVDNMGGAWGWGGVSVEPDGSAIWTALGNSSVYSDSCDCDVDTAGYGDSVVELSPALQPVASDRPQDVPATGDDDFGAAPLVFDVPACGGMAAANNKDGFLYVWSRDALSAGPLYEMGLGTRSGEPFVGEPSWSSREQTLYDASTSVLDAEGNPLGDGVTALRIDAFCKLRQVWATVTGSGVQPPPVVLGDVLFAAGGSGGWSALDARDGAVLWHLDTTSETMAPPIAADGRVFAATSDGQLYAFGA